MCEDEFMRDPEASPLDMIKALGDPMRLRIISALTTPRTVKQVGDYLGEDASKLYYHVKELYRVGLVDLVETRVVGGVAEKYYRATETKLDEEVQRKMTDLCQDDPEAAARMMSDLVNSVVANVLTEFSWVTGQIRENSEGEGELTMTILAKFLRLRPEKSRELAAKLSELVDEAGDPDAAENEQRFHLVTLLFPVRPSAG